MDGVVEDKDALFNDIFSHLCNVRDDPGSAKLEDDLLRRGERSLDASTPRQLLWRILQTGEDLLQTIQQDPRPLTKLLERTVQLIPFDELRQSISTQKLEEGLKSPSTPIQLLCLAYLTKAADQPSGAAFVASASTLVQLLVTTWLSVESTEVSERSLECIVAILYVDSPRSATLVMGASGSGEARGQGLMWRRIFHDADVYSLLFLWTSSKKSNYDLKTKKGQQAITISQARLFDFIARAAELDWAPISTSAMPAVENEFRKTSSDDQPYGGILRYAANDMIDSSDILMEVLRQDFFMKLLNVVEEGNSRQVLPRLIEAIQQGAGIQTSQDQSNGMHL